MAAGLSTSAAEAATAGMEFAKAEPGKTRIGFIGLGVMGQSMCSHLIKAGYEATVFTRTASKAASVVELGAKLVESPAEVGAASDVVITIVGYPSDVNDVILGDSGVLSTLNKGGVVVDMTTSEPSLARDIAAACAAKGCGSVDAPVSGGDIGAREARLSIMVGGDEGPVRAVWPLFEIMGKNVNHMGPPGAGQSTKCVNQTLVAASMIGACEALLFARKAGLDLDQTIKAVESGAAGSWTISNLGPRIVKRNFDPGFFIEHFLKDLGIVLKESKQMGISMPGTALAEQLYLGCKAQGFAKNGTQALMLTLERLAGEPGLDDKKTP